MARADELFINTVKHILEDGEWDYDQVVRPKWYDGEPAHALRAFGVVNRYDLSQEFPILTLRRVPYKLAIDELLWIWQKKSNVVQELDSGIWDSWELRDGTIGKAYGYQLGKKLPFRGVVMDQVDQVLYNLQYDPGSRRTLTNMYNHAEIEEMALAPCAYSMTFDVKNGKLNGLLNQRSQDMLVANGWNVTQYAVLLHLFARHANLEVGELVHVIANAHIYDRHIDLVKKLITLPSHPAPQLEFNEDAPYNFYDFQLKDLQIKNYQYNPFEHGIHVAV